VDSNATGEIEYRRMGEYAERGIPLPAEVIVEIERLAAEIGITPPEALRVT